MNTRLKEIDQEIHQIRQAAAPAPVSSPKLQRPLPPAHRPTEEELRKEKATLEAEKSALDFELAEIIGR